MKCKICETGRDDLIGDICVDCLADELSELFTRHPYRSITMINPDHAASTRHTVEDLKGDVARLKTDLASLKADVVRLKTRNRL